MLDETAAVACGSGIRPQPHFERGDGAGGSEPSLCHDEGDSDQVRKAKPQAIDPPPGAKVADNRENEAANDERDDGEMEREHKIREQLIRYIVAHLRCLKLELRARPVRVVGLAENG